MIRIMATIILALVISIGFLVPQAAAQSDKYSKMAPVDQYLMERNAEILLAQSAAPDSTLGNPSGHPGSGPGGRRFKSFRPDHSF